MKNVRKIYLLLLISLLIYSAGCDKEVSVTPPEPPLPKGKLFVSSFPEEALIFLNERFTGNLTPDTILFLAKGSYRLTLKKKYFKDITVNVKIVEDSLYDLFIDYRNYSGILGNINLDSKPRGAEIFIDDSSTGKITPTVLSNLFPGIHKINLKFEGYWDSNNNIEIESGKTIYPYITMVDSLFWVNFNPSNSGLPDLYVNHVAIDNDNIKWIGTLSKGLVRFDDNNWTVYNSTNSTLPADNIKFIGIDGQNKKWVCTQFGIVTFDDFYWNIYTSQNSGLPSDWVNCIAFDINGDKWIGTGNGLVKFDGNSWTVYDDTNSPLTSDIIESITIDEAGIKWIGTANQGMAKYDGSSWTIYNSRRTGFPKNVAGGIALDKNGIVWLGVAYRSSLPGGVAFSQDQFNWTNWVGTPSGDVRAIAVDINNNKWFANGESGVSKYNGSGWTNYTKANSKIPSDRIMSITIDHLGYKWISTLEGGLSKYKGD
jgi:ligand-binding sensor domain-containing protein